MGMTIQFVGHDRIIYTLSAAQGKTKSNRGTKKLEGHDLQHPGDLFLHSLCSPFPLARDWPPWFETWSSLTPRMDIARSIEILKES